MAQQRWSTPRLSDRELMNSIRQILLAQPKATGSIDTFGAVTLDVPQSLAGANELAAQLEQSDECLIASVAIAMGSMNFTYSRGDLDRSLPPTSVDRVDLSVSSPAPRNEADRMSDLRVVQQHWRMVRLGAVGGHLVDNFLTESVAMQAATVDRLNRVASETLEQTVQFQGKLAEDATAAEARRIADFEARRTELEAQFASRNEKLAAAERSLAERTNALDDRHNTHERRAIRKQLLDDVRARTDDFTLSADTEKKRLPVIFGIRAMLVVTAGLAVHALFMEYFPPQSTRALPVAGSTGGQGPGSATASPAPSERSFDVERGVNLGRGVLATFGFFGTLLFYVKWQDRWARRHEEAELQLRQFQLDVNRASWVVESCLEWRLATQSEVPADLLKTVSRGLFSGQDASAEQVVHPADALASALLGSASKLKLKSGDSEVEINNPGKKIPGTVGLGDDAAKK